MKDYQKDFGPFDGKIWLNCASEGPLPKIAVKAAHEAIAWKVHPDELTHERFLAVPGQLKEAIGRLLKVDSEDVILGNSATYGIHLFANGIPLRQKDEILVMQNDFPVDILPWLGLHKKGVVVRQLKPCGSILGPAEIEKNITPHTRVVCLSHVHTFTGHVHDLEAIGEICQKREIIFLVNLSQSAGTMPLAVSQLPIDGITCAGFKWLCGPYGTGFCWMRPSLRQRLDYNHSYWGNLLSAKQLEDVGELRLPEMTSARRYDVFGTANFFNFRPLTASIEYLLKIGIEKIHQHNAHCVDHILAGLDSKKYDVLSPTEPSQRSMLVVFSAHDRARNREIFQTLRREGIYLALWKGNLRISAHIYNTDTEIKRLLKVLNSI